jgi:hypothetical protein
MAFLPTSQRKRVLPIIHVSPLSFAKPFQETTGKMILEGKMARRGKFDLCTGGVAPEVELRAYALGSLAHAH